AEEQGVRERLGDLDLDREEGGRTVRETRRGLAAAPAILEYAEEAGIDLIAMGSHGRRGLRRLLLGSVTEEVLRAGRWPVLTVHGGASERAAPGYRRILAPVDFSKHTRGQVDACVALAERFGCGIELVHVVDPPIVPELYMPLAPLVADAKKATERATAGLEDLAAPLRSGPEVATEVLIGSPASEIARRAEATDLIVMPTHGYSGLDRVLLGSVAEGVLRRVDCAVLVLRPPD
ncbi:MAG: universal stress protein, partial [Gemmatimonadota bacterium]|nr:universal stress protein [Gemmatimonadota bacterium]